MRQEKIDSLNIWESVCSESMNSTECCLRLGECGQMHLDSSVSEQSFLQPKFLNNSILPFRIVTDKEAILFTFLIISFRRSSFRSDCLNTVRNKAYVGLIIIKMQNKSTFESENEYKICKIAIVLKVNIKAPCFQRLIQLFRCLTLELCTNFPKIMDACEQFFDRFATATMHMSLCSLITEERIQN